MERGIASPRSWAPEDVPRDARYPLLVKAREGFGSRHIYRADDREQLDFFLGYTTVPSFGQERCLGEEFSVDVFCDMDARCLNAIPRTMLLSKGGESIKGPRSRTGAHRARSGGRGDGRDQGPRQRAVLSGARRQPAGHRRQHPLRRRLPLPLAAGGRYPDSARAGAGERPEPRLGEFEEGVYMTRFFSEVCLTRDGDGSLRPLETTRSP